MPRKILITSALPYGNGSLHLGHLFGYIQADIWARFQRMRGNDCIYVCGTDAHGTSIMLRAEQEGISPEELVGKAYEEHLQDFKDFHIECDDYYTTHSDENRQLSELIYNRLRQRGDIETDEVEQAFDQQKQLFLPDRYVKGNCPTCDKPDQYGDSCEHCGATYNPTDLKNPLSIVSGQTPIRKKSQHYFFKLQNYTDLLQQWTHAGHLQSQMANKLNEWFDSGLKRWDISRDAPYFGFEIPDAPGKYFYVWLDAPIGYMASFKNLCDKTPTLNFDDYWGKESQAELYHFIGKDIIYFHSLFWPAMLHGADFRMPTAVWANGFVTINGEKMSKSRGTFIQARRYLQHLNPEYLRYYFAAKLTSRIEDIDINFDGFAARVNSDLVGKIVNIASRCSSFINKHFSGKLILSAESSILTTCIEAGDAIAELYEKREFNQAMRHIMTLADQVNRYIDDKKPWVSIKEVDQQQAVQQVCSVGLNAFKILITYLKPVVPQLANQAEAFLNIAPLTWDNRHELMCDHLINPFKPLLQRIDKDKLSAILRAG